MKIKLDLVGAVAMNPDFAMLRAGLAAVQANTPTAMAAHIVRPSVAPQDAFYALFAEGDVQNATNVMHGSFNAAAAALLDRQEK